MKIIDVVQGSPEWLKARCGIPTASNFHKIVIACGDKSKQIGKYMCQLAGERITGKIEEPFKSAAMQRGNDLEAEAREFYELVMGVKTQRVGFCLSENGYGASPDSFIGEDGGLEIKCPLISTHVEYFQYSDLLRVEYRQQIQGNMLVTGRKWWDLMSYYPGIKPVIVRIEADDYFQNTLSAELSNFCHELDLLVTKLKEK